MNTSIISYNVLIPYNNFSIKSYPKTFSYSLNLSTIPHDVRYEIFSHLDKKALCRLAQISQEYKKFANYNPTWKEKFIFKFGALTDQEIRNEKDKGVDWKENFKKEAYFRKLLKKNRNQNEFLIEKKGLFIFNNRKDFLKEGNLFQQAKNYLSYVTGYYEINLQKKINIQIQTCLDEQEELCEKIQKSFDIPAIGSQAKRIETICKKVQDLKSILKANKNSKHERNDIEDIVFNIFQRFVFKQRLANYNPLDLNYLSFNYYIDTHGNIFRKFKIL